MPATTPAAAPVAIVTGASRGLGRALAAALHAGGWALVVDARTPDDLRDATTTFTGPAPVAAIAGDVADPAHRDALVAAARSLGPLRLVVNNASVLGPSPQPALRDYPLEVLEEVYRVNTLAPLALVQRARPHLEDPAAVVLVTSDAAVEAYPGWGGYGSSKAALEQLGAVLAAEEPVLRVYTFDPGDMRTRMHQEAFPGEDISDRPEPETVVPALLRLVRERPPSGRYRAAELAALAVPAGATAPEPVR